MVLAGVEGVAELGGAAVAGPQCRRELVPGDASVVAGRLGDAGWAGRVETPFQIEETPPAPVDGCYFSAVPGFPLMDS